MFDVKEQFLNHPGDMMKSFLARTMGKEIGFAFTKKAEQECLNWIGIAFLDDEIDKISKESGATKETVKFNKKNCKRIGMALINGQRTSGIMFRDLAQETYESSMQTVATEMYAEMIKYSLLYPDLIGNDSKIINGINLVFNTISNGLFNFQSAREILRKIDNSHIQERNDIEQEIINNPLEQEINVEQSDVEKDQAIINEKVEIIEDLQVVKDNKLSYEECTTSGELQGSERFDSDNLELAKKYMRTVKQIVATYPILMRGFASHLDEIFDPYLHIWEIEKIESAMESGFISKLLFDEIDDQQQISKDLTEKTQVLVDFINSEAFGS